MSTFKTTLATSNPLDICEGFPLFGGHSNVDVGATDQGRLLHGTVVGNGISLSGNLDHTFFLGLCGPSYAISLELQGDTDTGVFTATADDIQAGLVWGLSWSLILDFHLDVWSSEDPNGTDFPLSYTGNLDLLQLLFTLILAKLGNQSLSQVANIFPQLQSSWGMFDEARGEVALFGQMAVNPALVFPINLAPLVELLPVVGEPLAAVNKVLGRFGGGLQFGPTFAIGLEVELFLDTLAVDGFGPASVDFVQGPRVGDNPIPSPGSFRFNPTGPRVGAPGSPASLVIRHQVTQVDFGIGLFASVTIGGGLNLSTNLGPFSIGHIDVNGDVHRNTLNPLPSFSVRDWEVTFG